MSFWRAWLGHWCRVSPSDLADLTPMQMMDCLNFVDRATKR